MKQLNYLWLVLLLTACASFNLGTAPTDKLAAGYASVSAARGVSTRLLNQDRLSSTQGKAAVELADQSRVLLDSGLALVKAGNGDAALSDIDLARGVLEQLEAYLLAKQKEVKK